MINRGVDLKKSEEENQNSSKRGANKFFAGINDFLSLEFFCNFAMAIQLDILMGAFLAIQNASMGSFLRVFDLFLAITGVVSYMVFLFYIVSMTYKIMTSSKDRLLDTHYKTKYKSWMFIIEPLVEFKNEAK